MMTLTVHAVHVEKIVYRILNTHHHHHHRHHQLVPPVLIRFPHANRLVGVDLLRHLVVMVKLLLLWSTVAGVFESFIRSKQFDEFIFGTVQEYDPVELLKNEVTEVQFVPPSVE
jgi:hypothetical protein